MVLFYKVSPKKLLEVRNELFKKNGIPALEKNGFEKSPFSTDWFGKNNLGDYMYTHCRLNANSNLEIIDTFITRGDSWIKVILNIFELRPNLESLAELKGGNGMQFGLPPNVLTRMRIRVDDFKGMPLFNTKEHKIHSFYSERGFQKRVDELSELIERDLTNIDFFISRWHELHQPLVTNWEGKPFDLSP